MTDKKAQAPKQELQNNYRPLGLKAVAAAAMMLKRKPARAKQA